MKWSDGLLSVRVPLEKRHRLLTAIPGLARVTSVGVTGTISHNKPSIFISGFRGLNDISLLRSQTPPCFSLPVAVVIEVVIRMAWFCFIPIAIIAFCWCFCNNGAY